MLMGHSFDNILFFFFLKAISKLYLEAHNADQNDIYYNQKSVLCFFVCLVCVCVCEGGVGSIRVISPPYIWKPIQT